MEEIWKDLSGYEGLYEVSSLGRVKKLGNNKTKKERIMAQTTNNYGYLSVGLTVPYKKKTHKTHRLVAQAFIPNPFNKPEVNHKDGVKTNNHVDNLEWATRSENMKHSYRTGLIIATKGADTTRSVPISQYTKDGTWIKDWPGGRQVMRETGWSSGSISSCTTGKLKTAHGFIWRKTN